MRRALAGLGLGLAVGFVFGRRSYGPDDLRGEGEQEIPDDVLRAAAVEWEAFEEEQGAWARAHRRARGER